MRRLSTEDARRVLDDAEHVLKKHSFVYTRSWIRVLSGKEEAYYGWVALNYKMGVLGNSSQRSTLGLLDLVGSLLQVVMEVHGGARDDMHLIRTKIGLVEHQISAYSLPLFGLNEAFDRTVAMLSQLQPTKQSTADRSRIKHPCVGFGSVEKYICHACDGQNITYQKNFRKMNKSEYTYLVGDLDWEQCKGIARASAINSSSLDLSQPKVGTYCKASLSSYAGGNILNLTAGILPIGRFHALSGFYAVYNILNLAPKANLSMIWEKGEQMCSKSWGYLSNISGNRNCFGRYCFRVTWHHSLRMLCVLGILK